MRPFLFPRTPLNASSRLSSQYIFPPSLISVVLARPRIITSTRKYLVLPSLPATRHNHHRHMPVPVSPFYVRDHDKDALGIALATSDMTLSDHSPFLFDDAHSFDTGANDSNNMIFDFDDTLTYESKPAVHWSPSHADYPVSSSMSFFDGSPESTTSQLDFGPPPHLASGDRSYTSGMLGGFSDVHPHPTEFNYSHWIADPDAQHPHTSSSTSAPIDIPLSPSHSSAASSFGAFSENSSIFPDVSPYSPTTAFAALHPLPRSFSPGEDASDATGTLRQYRTPAVSFTSSDGSSMSPPMWASHLFSPTQAHVQPTHSVGSPVYPSSPLSEDAYATQRPRTHSRRSIAPVADVFHSASAPSASHMRPPLSRAYSSRRSESISEHDDRDATVRRKKRSFVQDDEDHRPAEKESKPEGERQIDFRIFEPWIDRDYSHSPDEVLVAPSEARTLGLAALLH